MPTEYRNLTSFFYPKSVAVVGASRDPQKLGAIVLKSIIESGFSGGIYPVNPNADNLQDLTTYKDVHSLPDEVELAIVAIPAAIAVDAVHHLGEKGVRNVVVLSAGFKFAPLIFRILSFKKK